MPICGDPSSKLCDLIQKAMDDGKITDKEFNQIHTLAAEDGVVDAREHALLAQLNDMIADKTVVRARD